MFVYLVTYLADADPFDKKVNIFQEEVTVEEKITQVDDLVKHIVDEKESQIKPSNVAQNPFGGLNLKNEIASIGGKLEGISVLDGIAILSFLLLREK